MEVGLDMGCELGPGGLRGERYATSRVLEGVDRPFLEHHRVAVETIANLGQLRIVQCSPLRMRLISDRVVGYRVM